MVDFSKQVVEGFRDIKKFFAKSVAMVFKKGHIYNNKADKLKIEKYLYVYGP